MLPSARPGFRSPCSLRALLVGAAFLSQGSAALAGQRVFGVLGDAGKWLPETQVVRDSMARLGAKRLIMPGDNLYEPETSYEKVWSPWRALGFVFDLVAIGNHTAGYAQEISYFGMPGEYYSRALQSGAARFIVLNSDNVTNVPEQLAWLDQELTAARERQIFLVYHHPTWTISEKHSWREKPEFQLGLRRLLVKHRARLTASLVGHDHLAEILHAGDYPLVVSGVGHGARPGKPVDYVEDQVRVRTAWFYDQKPTWVRLVVDDQTAATKVDFIRATDDRVTCSALLAPGLPALLHQSCGPVRWR